MLQNSAWIVLSNAICFRVSGRDARRYLHNRLSQDIRALKSGQSARAAALSAQGRVEGLFSVWCEGDDSFLLVCDGGDPRMVEAALKRFIVADRVVCDDVSDQACLVHFAAEECLAVECLKLATLPKLCSFSLARIAGYGVDLLVASGDREYVSSKLVSRLGAGLSRERYDYMRWAAGYPVFPEEINEQGMVLEFGLRDAVSFTKGCYVGQEVVERSDAIGRVPRSLARIALEGNGTLDSGEPVNTPAGVALGKVAGTINSSGSYSEIATVSLLGHFAGKYTTYLFALLGAGKYKEGDRVECAGRAGVIVA